MVQRATAVRICRVCGGGSLSLLELEDHASFAHGTGLEAARLAEYDMSPGDVPIRYRRTTDTMEFRSHMQNTPWGQDFKDPSLRR